MASQKVLELTKSFEDPEYPLLGPTLKSLYVFGLWQIGSRTRTAIYNTLHIFSFIFVITQYVDLYTVRRNLNKMIDNLSVTLFSMICLVKTFSFVRHQARWRLLVNEISEVELELMKPKDKEIMKRIKEYTVYTRLVTCIYWFLMIGINIVLMTSPILKYMSSATYRDEIENGTEPPPLILCSWFPFNSTTKPGYIWAILIDIVMSIQGCGVVATFDMNAVAIMSYLKGQTGILKDKCKAIFGSTSRREVVDRIRDCHRHHNVLIRHYQIFDSLLSPIMFIYVLICSLTMCCSIVQLGSNESTVSQRVWIVQYSIGQIFQLFLYCWHSNEFGVETMELNQGLYDSEWWKGDVFLRRQILLLSGKLSQTFILNAGAHATLSVPTFIAIVKGTYSFYTLFSQMQE